MCPTRCLLWTSNLICQSKLHVHIPPPPHRHPIPPSKAVSSAFLPIPVNQNSIHPVAWVKIFWDFLDVSFFSHIPHLTQFYLVFFRIWLFLTSSIFIQGIIISYLDVFSYLNDFLGFAFISLQSISLKLDYIINMQVIGIVPAAQKPNCFTFLLFLWEFPAILIFISMVIEILDWTFMVSFFLLYLDSLYFFP